jgi:Tfp pilus assembly protein PilP
MIGLGAEASPEVPSSDAPTAPMSSPVTSPVISNDLLTLRDPFKAPKLDVSVEKRGDLERYPVEEYKLSGVMTGPDRTRAMIQAPDGNSYLVSEKMKIGMNHGIIKSITPEKLVVKERMQNAIGQEEIFETEIKLPSLIRSQDKIDRGEAQAGDSSSGAKQ